MEQFCMGCGGMVTLGAACPEPGKAGCVQAQTKPDAPKERTPRKRRKQKGGR